MHPQGSAPFRAAIVARARFIEDLVSEQAQKGVDQYVILGAGLDTFAQRRADLASRLRVFELDQPETQAWKRQRLDDLGYGVPDWLRMVPVDFEKQDGWAELAEDGFDPMRPAVVVATGLTMYITKEAAARTLRRFAALAPGSTVVLSFLLTADLVDEADRPGLEMAERGLRASGTPFISFYTPDEIVSMARDAGFTAAEHASGKALAQRYFSGRSDGLRPSTGEDFLIATT
jgi:methyltransferase (TIGR00027 family)